MATQRRHADAESGPLQIPDIVFLDDLARILKTSKRSIQRLRAQKAMPKGLRELDAIDHRPRWSGRVVRQFIDGLSGQKQRVM